MHSVFAGLFKSTLQCRPGEQWCFLLSARKRRLVRQLPSICPYLNHTSQFILGCDHDWVKTFLATILTPSWCVELENGFTYAVSICCMFSLLLCVSYCGCLMWVACIIASYFYDCFETLKWSALFAILSFQSLSARVMSGVACWVQLVDLILSNKCGASLVSFPHFKSLKSLKRT